MPARQPFVVIGAQKSATTSLIEMLAAHSDVYAPRQEVSWFGEPYDRDVAAERIREISMRSHPAHAYGFKRADVFHSSEGVRRLADHMPEAILIALLREPVARTTSAYFHYVRGGLIPALPIEVGLPSILDGHSESHGTLARQIIDYSHYAPQLEAFRRVYGRNLIVFTQDSLRADHTSVLRSCFEALGVAADGHVAQSPVVTNLGVYSLRRLRWLHAGSRLVYQHRPTDDYFTIHPSRARWAAHYGIAGVDRLLFGRRHERPPELSEDLRARLGALFPADIAAAEKAVGHSLPRWRQAAMIS